MRVGKRHLVDRSGISDVSGRFAQNLGWLFREQPISDFGIDAQIECVIKGRVTGRLIAAQIKSGKSFFKKDLGNAFLFRGQTKHLNYWLKHSLPVIVIIVDPKTNRCFWEHVTERNVTRHAKGWSLKIPKSQTIDKVSAQRLKDISNSSPNAVSLGNLSGEKSWMLALQSGKKLILTVDEWINKTSGRGDFRLFIIDKAGKEKTLARWPSLFLGLEPYEQALSRFFPWATIQIDEEFYEDYDIEKWNEACGHWDKEEDRFGFHDMEFLEWKDRLPILRPYELVSDEVAKWRLELTLNSLGTAFLRIDEYLKA